MTAEPEPESAPSDDATIDITPAPLDMTPVASAEENKEQSIISPKATPKSLKKLSDALFELFVDRKIQQDPTPAFICDGLYLGSVGSARNREELERLGVTHILCVAGGIRPAFPDVFTYKTIAIEDSSNVRINTYFDSTFDYIDELINKGGKVLVHCFAGKSRSVTITCAYLIRKEQMPLGDALRLIKSRRAVANPNPGFLIQLLRYQTKLGIHTNRSRNGGGPRRRSEPVVSPSVRVITPQRANGLTHDAISVPPTQIFAVGDDENKEQPPPHLMLLALDSDGTVSPSPSSSPMGPKPRLLFSADSEMARKSRQIYESELAGVGLISPDDQNQDVIRDIPPARITAPTELENTRQVSSFTSSSMGSSNRSLAEPQLSPAASHTSRNSASSLGPIDEDRLHDFEDEDSESNRRDRLQSYQSDDFLSTPR